MDRKGYKGSITVFLSLTCILFLSLICAVVESARVQGAEAQTANIAGMGNFSLLGEFEKGLLEQYGIFSLDGSYGSGAFEIEKLKSRLQEYISYNTDPGKGIHSSGAFDPWQLELTECRISGYTLLTDGSGEPFYQQAVSAMKAGLPTMAVGRLLEYTKHMELIQSSQKEYEEKLEENEGRMEQLEEQKQQKLEEMELEAEANGGLPVQLPQQERKNPLKEIAKLRRKSTLEIVTWDKDISEKNISLSGLPSRSRVRKGTLPVVREHGGLVNHVLFREYLMMHFPNYLSKTSKERLAYQLEYILCGKRSDRDNLKRVVNRLLLMREGLNYLYCLKNHAINTEASGLAAALTGFIGIPALTSATKHALLLAWAYGESLMDVRILLDGGKVPIFKDEQTWALSLDNLGRMTQMLEQGADGKDKGLSYSDYLRVLLNMGTLMKQKLRALDLIQMEMQAQKGSETFLAENCIVAVQSDTEWSCAPVFLRLPGAVMGVSGQNLTFQQQSGMAY